MRRSIIAAAVGGTLLLTGCGVDTSTDTIGLHYGGGVSEEKEFKGCIAPGTTNGGPNGFSGDDVYNVPYGQRDYSFGTGGGQERGVIKSTALGGVDMDMRGTITLELTHDCKKLDTLWRQVGQRYRIDTDEGWVAFLNKFVGSSAEKGLDLASQTHEPKLLMNDATTYQALVKAVAENALAETNRLLGGEYFTGPGGSPTFGVVLQKPDNPALKVQFQKSANEREAKVTAIERNARLVQEAKGIGTLQKQYGRDYLTVKLIELCETKPEACQNWLVPPGGSLGSGAGVLVQPKK